MQVTELAKLFPNFSKNMNFKGQVYKSMQDGSWWWIIGQFVLLNCTLYYRGSYESSSVDEASWNNVGTA